MCVCTCMCVCVCYNGKPGFLSLPDSNGQKFSLLEIKQGNSPKKKPIKREGLKKTQSHSII